MTTTSSRLLRAAGAASETVTPLIVPPGPVIASARRTVEIGVEITRGLRRQPRHRLELVARGAQHRLRRAEVLQQRALALRADAGQAVEHRLGHLAVAARAVVGDREAVRLVDRKSGV